MDDAWAAYEARSSPTLRGKLPAIWRSHLGPKFKGIPLSKVTPVALRRWEQWMRANGNGGIGYAHGTIRSTWDHLRTALRGARHAYEPWRRFRLQEARAPLSTGKSVACSPQEVAAILKAADAYAATDCEALPDLTERILTMMTLQLRPSEGIALSWRDVSFDQDGVRVAIRHVAPEGWIRSARRTGDGTGTRYQGNPVPTQASKWARERGPLPLDGVVALALRTQRQRLLDASLYKEDGPVFPMEDGGYRHRYFLLPATVRELGSALGPGGRWVQQSFAYSAMLLAMRAGPGSVLRDPQIYGHRALDELVLRAPDLRPLVSYQWLQEVLSRESAATPEEPAPAAAESPGNLSG